MSDMLAMEGSGWWNATDNQWIAKALIGGEDVYWGPFESFAALAGWVDKGLTIGVACVQINSPAAAPSEWVTGGGEAVTFNL